MVGAIERRCVLPAAPAGERSVSRSPAPSQLVRVQSALQSPHKTFPARANFQNSPPAPLAARRSLSSSVRFLCVFYGVDVV